MTIRTLRVTACKVASALRLEGHSLGPENACVAVVVRRQAGRDPPLSLPLNTVRKQFANAARGFSGSRRPPRS